MKILVCSCDKNQNLGSPFHHCIEKYGQDHPEIIYSTETKLNPYYSTICKNYPLDKGTRRIRETAQEIDDQYILIMVDDVFIRNKVDNKLLLDLEKQMYPNVASINLQVMSDDKRIEYIGHNLWKMPNNSKYKTSVMCSLGNKGKLLDVFDTDKDPWSFELDNDSKNYDYYRLSKPIINGGGEISGSLFGVYRGKGIKETIDFLAKEGIKCD